ncbi:MAG: hypothetical protein ACFFCS_20400 [Candidatus Hodarchaeota archaeon]
MMKKRYIHKHNCSKCGKQWEGDSFVLLERENGGIKTSNVCKVCFERFYDPMSIALDKEVASKFKLEWTKLCDVGNFPKIVDIVVLGEKGEVWIVDDKAIKIMDIHTGKQKDDLEFEYIQKVKLSPDRSMLAVIGFDITLVPVKNPHEQVTFKEPDFDPPVGENSSNGANLEFFPSGRKMVVAHESVFGDDDPAESRYLLWNSIYLCILDVDSREMVKKEKIYSRESWTTFAPFSEPTILSEEGSKMDLDTICMSRDGTKLYYASGREFAYYDLQSLKRGNFDNVHPSIQSHLESSIYRDGYYLTMPAGIMKITILKNGDLIVLNGSSTYHATINIRTGEMEQYFRIFNIRDTREDRRNTMLPLACYNPFNFIKHGEAMLAVLTTPGYLEIWDVEKRALVASCSVPRNAMGVVGGLDGGYFCILDWDSVLHVAPARKNDTN